MAFDMKSFSLEGKVALVTGAAYGIGFAIAEAYAQAGAKIAFNCRGQKHMDEALAAYAEKGIDAKGYFCDVTKEDEVAQMPTGRVAAEVETLVKPLPSRFNFCISMFLVMRKPEKSVMLADTEKLVLRVFLFSYVLLTVKPLPKSKF